MMRDRRSLAALIIFLLAALLAFAPATTATTTMTMTSRGELTAPTLPPAQICGNPSVLNGPVTAPPGAVTVPAGDNSAFFTNEKFSGVSGRTYWFEPGTHTLGTSEWGQIEARPNSTYVGAPGTVVDGKGVNRYLFTGESTGVTIKHLSVRNFVAPSNEGTINSNAATGWAITNNTIENNGGAGVFTGDNVLIQDNCITRNGAHGVSGFKTSVAVGYGASAINNVTVTRNEISHHPRDTNLERNPDGTDTHCGCTAGAKFWDTKGAVVTDNWVHQNQSPGLWADTNNIDFLFEGNYLSDNGAEAIWYEISYNATIRNNTLVRNTWEKGARRAGGNFPDGPIYIAESGGDSRVSPNRTTLEITGNYLEDNWGGVALWEAAERFCASPGNTSSGYCTKVNPAISHTVCSDMNLIKSEPYYSDCRWKTQNVLVSGNTFKLNRANLPASCTGSANCGQAALFSGYGVDYPIGTPYEAYVVADRITYASNNRFVDNTYIGDWGWTAHNAGNKLSWTSWRAAPSSQDAGSACQGCMPTHRGVVAGSTWYSDGTKTQAGLPGAVIAAYAVGAIQNVPYRLVLGTGDSTHACTTVVQVVNPTIVYAGPSGLIGTVWGTLQPGLAAGTYKLCFEDASSGNATGTGGATFTVM